jgi:hypothetical protein
MNISMSNFHTRSILAQKGDFGLSNSHTEKDPEDEVNFSESGPLTSKISGKDGTRSEIFPKGAD